MKYVGNCQLPVEPFARWLEARVEAEGLNVFARRVGYQDPRPLRVILDRGKRRRPQLMIKLDTVDRILTADDTTLLQELYPELYVDAVA